MVAQRPPRLLSGQTILLLLASALPGVVKLGMTFSIEYYWGLEVLGLFGGDLALIVLATTLAVLGPAAVILVRLPICSPAQRLPVIHDGLKVSSIHMVLVFVFFLLGSWFGYINAWNTTAVILGALILGLHLLGKHYYLSSFRYLYAAGIEFGPLLVVLVLLLLGYRKSPILLYVLAYVPSVLILLGYYLRLSRDTQRRERPVFERPFWKVAGEATMTNLASMGLVQLLIIGALRMGGADIAGAVVGIVNIVLAGGLLTRTFSLRWLPQLAANTHTSKYKKILGQYRLVISLVVLGQVAVVALAWKLVVSLRPEFAVQHSTLMLIGVMIGLTASQFSIVPANVFLSFEKMTLPLIINTSAAVLFVLMMVLVSVLQPEKDLAVVWMTFLFGLALVLRWLFAEGFANRIVKVQACE